MSMEESISLEETNKIRISLGLKPLTDDKGPADSADAAAEKNFAKRRDAERKAAETKRIFDNIAKVKNKRELNAGLKGRTLADLDENEADVDDARKWVKRSKKQEKILAKKRQEELDNIDKEIQEEYTERDLAGLKVLHDLNELEEGKEQILTLKDSRILDNEEDELLNVEMAEHERTKKAQELKVKKPQYTGYDDDEFGNGNAGMKRAVLAKYDLELEGAQDSGFRLGSNVAAQAKVPQTKQEVAETLNRSLLSIDYSKNMEASDYLQAGDKGFKKPKTKKKRETARKVEVDPEIAVDAMDVDEKKPIVSRRRVVDSDANLIDDDDLQASLARTRQAKIRKTTKPTPEEIAARIAGERAAEQSAASVKVEEEDSAVPTEEEAQGGLVFDDTSEFVRTIQYNATAPKAVKREPQTQSVPAPRQESDQMQIDGDVAITELEAGEVNQEDDSDDDEAMLDDIENAMKLLDQEEGGADAADDEFGVGTSSEQTVGSGLAGALSILRKQGIIGAPKQELTERESVQKQRDVWLAEQRRRLNQRETDRFKIRQSGKDQATREHENRLREQQEARESVDHFKNYKPDVNIVYYDEFGRSLSMKEAWKALSHRFHGKLPGRMKQEKRLKKIADEKRREAMASGDTPLNMNAHFQQRQELAGQAHMVLSVGNRGAVPKAEAFIDQPNLSKKIGDKKKGKLDGATLAPDITGFTSAQPLAAAGAMESANATPAPRAGFKRIGSFAPAGGEARNAAATPPTAGETAKVTIGLKRKAGDEGTGTPPTKKR